jgi:HEAT repeat protein
MRDRRHSHTLGGRRAGCTFLCLVLLVCCGCPRRRPPPADEAAPAAADADGSLSRETAPVPQAPGVAAGLRRPVRFYPRRGSEAADRRVEEAAAAFAAAVSPDERIRILQDLRRICHPGVIPIVRQALGDGDPDVREEGLAALGGYASADLLPLVEQALGDPVPAVREQAAGLLADISEGPVAASLLRALADADPDVRDEALSSLEERPYAERLQVIESALRECPFPAVRQELVSQLQDIGDPNAMDLLIEAFRDRDATVREEANGAIFFLVSEDFAAYAEARRWWDANRHRYDDQLFENED